jgi:membrane protease YdiL (CAAX protease family)
MPGPLDLAFAALFAVGSSLWEYFVGWPRLRAKLAAGVPGARVRGYRYVLIAEWLAALVVVALWVSADRAWVDLGITVPSGWRLLVSGVLVTALAWLSFLQARAVARLSPDRRVSLRPKLGLLAMLCPHDAEEHRWFVAVSVTAGVCEELLFRGFLVWTLAPWCGVFGAAAISVVLFGFAHAYLGVSGCVRATLLGAVFGALALLTRSILPCMALHAIVDLGSGAVAYALLRADA